jgi:hypothetical protein
VKVLKIIHRHCEERSDEAIQSHLLGTLDCFVAALLAMTILLLALPAIAEQAPQHRLVAMRRITQEQYRQIIQDVFGRTIKLAGRFEPDQREAGLIAVGAGEASVTASGFEQYDGMARGIANQVVDPDHRTLLVPCRPADPAKPDDVCATQFVTRVGRLLYRRPLTERELAAEVKIASDDTARLNDFYAGLGLSLAGMLDSAQFLFRQEFAEADPGNPGTWRLDPYSKASRLSFLLWNAAPDALLLDAAGKGDLDTESGLKRQADRMLTSSRLENGVRAFFSDMLGFSAFATLSKDPLLYPKFTARVAEAAQEQTLRTLVDLLIRRNGDYRDIFTTRETFLTPVLGAVYKIPVLTSDDLTEAWVPYTYPSDGQQAGIVTEASFVALHGHPGRSSPTIRGKALREILLCQKVPDPPGNVNFTIVQDTSNPQYRTARERVTAHRSNPTCAGCHKIMDPIGLSLENFDTTGAFRISENGTPIDASGELDGVKFTDASGLGKALHDSPAASACLVNRMVAYGIGRPAAKEETQWITASLLKDFASGGYHLVDLMREIATSDTFYRARIPEIRAGDLPAVKLAARGDRE